MLITDTHFTMNSVHIFEIFFSYWLLILFIKIYYMSAYSIFKTGLYFVYIFLRVCLFLEKGEGREKERWRSVPQGHCPRRRPGLLRCARLFSLQGVGARLRIQGGARTGTTGPGWRLRLTLASSGNATSRESTWWEPASCQRPQGYRWVQEAGHPHY